MRTRKPRDRSREIALRIHAGARRLQQQTAESIHPAPQSNEAVVWLPPSRVDLRRQARRINSYRLTLIAERGEFWWNPRRPADPVLWDSKIYLGEAFFNEIIRHPVPLDMNTLTALKRSSLGLDSVPLAGVPDLPASRSAAAHLARSCTASLEMDTGPAPAINAYRPKLPVRGLPA